MSVQPLTRRRPVRLRRLGPLFMAFLLLLFASSRAPAHRPVPHLGYGFNQAVAEYGLLQGMGFDWVKLFAPPAGPQPVRVLLRLAGDATHMADLGGYGDMVAQIARDHGAYVDANEVGNEPNLDASYGWTAPPVAQDYATLLCTAFNRIRQEDPSAIVVSAGLAPTGRVSGNWNGHPGHNGLHQDERAFLGEFLTAGGGACLDAVGYHPYGFSADYDATPDLSSGDPRQNCSNGFCFRGVEKIYEIMQLHGLGARKVWATEFGWITPPPAHCLADPGWAGRAWQIVSLDQQATNLRGAFAYADGQWPWMGAMFVFNLNFNTAPWYPTCEQMRYYAVKDRPAETALRDLPKNPATPAASLLAYPPALTWLIQADQQPQASDLRLTLRNGGWVDTSFMVTADGGADLVPVIGNGSGTLTATGETVVNIGLSSAGRPVGVYGGEMTLTGTPGTLGSPTLIPLTLHVVPALFQTFLPSVATE